MKLVIFGLTVSSSWGNGHATTWRGLLRALIRRGHRVVFFERDVPYYAAHRDLHELTGGTLMLYSDWGEARPLAEQHLADADVGMVTSYCPDGMGASELVLESCAGLRTSYDLDTPVTLSHLRAGRNVTYIGPRGLQDFDLVFSYTGGRALEALRDELGARTAVPLCGSVDPEVHRPVPPVEERNIRRIFPGPKTSGSSGTCHRHCTPRFTVPHASPSTSPAAQWPRWATALPADCSKLRPGARQHRCRRSRRRILCGRWHPPWLSRSDPIAFPDRARCPQRAAHSHPGTRPTRNCMIAEVEPQLIERRVRELGPWFHNLDLRGVRTAPEHFLGDYPAMKWRAFADAIPADLSGRTVLDIGCNAGYYSIEMKRRGAHRVVGIDFDETYLAQARFAAQVLGAEIEFHRLSVYDVARLGEKFDVVLFMGVFYHLRHPLLALDLIHEHVCKNLFVFQSMQRGSDEVADWEDDYHFGQQDMFGHPAFPRMHFIEKQYCGDPTNWWVPNRACSEAMLRSAGFEIVDHPEEEVFICRWQPIDAAHAVYPAA